MWRGHAAPHGGRSATWAESGQKVAQRDERLRKGAGICRGGSLPFLNKVEELRDCSYSVRRRVDMGLNLPVTQAQCAARSNKSENGGNAPRHRDEAGKVAWTAEAKPALATDSFPDLLGRRNCAGVGPGTRSGRRRADGAGERRSHLTIRPPEASALIRSRRRRTHARQRPKKLRATKG